MIVCDFCRHYKDRQCRLGLSIPKAMTCREFDPSIEQFFSDPKDFVSSGQVMQMAKFFGFQRTETKKIKLMASQEEHLRTRKRNEASTVSDLSETNGVPTVEREEIW